jgi:hypothetical protein
LSNRRLHESGGESAPSLATTERPSGACCSRCNSTPM